MRLLEQVTSNKRASEEALHTGYSWQEFQYVVRTMRWDEIVKGISDGELAEIEIEIEHIRQFLDT